ncbi:hypothetical protein Odosp_1884 [Odoribacter splanchnicus DSM 20712]|jgi:hypothetical protein|uniref:Thiol:disulfide interchange protein DsbD N-terminal domain-containing protein n=1 Tax=Odoribacter splanchnicus (strain ATCC 29572 / DSM 20712 / CIP 104287 / JCM 15291 / NCTC 10825 / 1651/6) TaxID=709991 RepID=F9Z7G9_ODOSD|nr:protein-disulfide reductase DsbD domain-containing protein [Odoribacter splanchnicus]ADY32894.1 hypothetical protein Odosp_1884 [Odoribacter splanchnicus DSM 20712]UEB85980.1 protein-disulfide reductase DsbD N-terminal domain-containing protein [Odoribacter splanchnicus DSM 20712]SNV36307.1 Thiol:disulfide interchange protein [Odoribacter splanchnicus]
MKKNLLLIGLFLCSYYWGWGNVKKSDLKVLYVGGSADIASGYGVEVDAAVLQKSINERKAAFEEMLKQYFISVTSVDAKDYYAKMSDDYDVTVMDGRPAAISPERRIKNENGEVVKYVRAGYLPADFDRPMLLIGELGDIVGRSIGLKTDWYCLCLDAHAHHFRTEHPIFHKPFPVKMTTEMRPTPPDAYHYAYYYDGTIPDSILMWRVQTRGYQTDEGFRIGMVARPWGFEDSPDAEYISSGVCAKTLNAVAIGRHGNFLHWGFAASPKYMTEEAKTVLANAIVYISQFAGETPIARKYNDRIATKEYIKEVAYLSTLTAWKERVKSDKEWEAGMLMEQKKALEKLAKGNILSGIEKDALAFKPQKPMSYEDFLKRYQKRLFEKLGMDEVAYARYYKDNYDYFYGGEGMYNLVVDEDVKSLGIPNNDIRLLDKTISMLEHGEEVDKAKRILKRYTLCRFSTAQEWRDWLTANRDKIFFTEAGGWLYLVNTRDKNIPGNDYQVKEQQEEEKKSELTTDDKNPVAIEAAVENLPNGNKCIAVRVKIYTNYHIYAKVATIDPYIPTELKIELPQGYQKEGELQRPSFKALNDAGTTIYEDEVVFKQEIKGIGTGKVSCIMTYQCCDNHICFPPMEKKIVLDLNK